MSTATEGRARDMGLVRLISAEIEPTLYDALEECATRTRYKKKVIITMALEKYLTEQGLWPPKKNGGKKSKADQADED